MKKFSLKLSRKERDELLFEFFRSLGTIRGVEEAAQVFGDLVSRQELEMLAKRLKIATLLIEGETYEEIRKRMKASEPTIARVSAWLQHSGAGFRLLYQRSQRQRSAKRSYESSIHKKYPLYYWPQLLIQELLETASRKERERIYQVIDNLDHKRKIYKDLKLLLAKARY